MRLVGTLNHQDEAARLSSHLKQQGIENTCEVNFDPKNGHMSYQLWVHDEDRMEEATTIFENFLTKSEVRTQGAPKDASSLGKENAEVRTVPRKASSLGAQEVPPQRRARTPFTMFVLVLCSLIFLFTIIEMIPLKREGLPESAFLVNPIPSVLLFDFPPPFEKLKEIVQKYALSLQQKPMEVPPEVKAELEGIENLPFWRGIYSWILLKVKGKDTSFVEGPLFYKIRQGELWRLFTPCLLHGSLLHILFNMIWVWILGKPIELRIGVFRTVLLTLASGIIPNIAQYLMSGPLFLGYSGVVLGLAGFTWMRERIAPWEGYPLNRSTILFLLFFIGAMFALQFASFLMQIFTKIPFEPNIANTAHIVGALVGAGLGRLSYFSWRVK